LYISPVNQATILRQISASEILSIVETVLQSNNPSTLQLIGEAGAGKTTLLNQLKTYLENYGIFPHKLFIQTLTIIILLSTL